MKKYVQGDDYIKKFPKLKKWINECSCCHKKGYDPNIPDKITIDVGSYEVFYIKKYFEPLLINEDGLCPQCEHLLKRSSNAKQ